MGRKRLTKQCTQCMQEHERKDFLRSEWEKDVNTMNRLCRACDLQVKKSKEAAVLLSPLMMPALPSAMIDSVDLFFPEIPLAPTTTTTTANNDEDDDDEDFKQFEDLFAFADDLDNNAVSQQQPTKEQTRSLQAKRRRAKLNSLFSCLAEEVGLSAQADRVTILEESRNLIAELRAQKKQRLLEEDFSMTPTFKPMVSIADLSVEADLQAITHSALA